MAVRIRPKAGQERRSASRRGQRDAAVRTEMDGRRRGGGEVGEVVVMTATRRDRPRHLPDVPLTLAECIWN